MESAKNTLFENPSVDLNLLPSTEDIVYNKLAIGYLWVMILRSNAFFIILSVVAGIITFVNNDFEIKIWLYIVGGWFLFWILFNVMIPFKYNKKGYAVRELDITYKSGLWWRKKIIIPFNRIQHCEVQQGPFSKIFGLRSLTVYTAGGGNSDLRVAGIPEQQAEDLKEFVLSKITTENERNQ